VSYCNASTGSEIDASNGTNIDGGDTVNWNFGGGGVDVNVTGVPAEAVAVGVPPEISAWTGVDGEIWVNTDDKGTYVWRNSAKHILESDAGLILPVASKTATYTLLEADAICLCTGTFVVTLPTAVGITGKTYFVKNVSTGVITLDGDGTETIDGDTTQAIYQNDTAQVASDGSNWVIL